MVTAETVAAAVEEFRDKIEQNDIASDGLVLTFDSIAYSQSLGRTAKFPKDSIAFKWADEMAETTLRRIEWNTSRTGLMNPVAVFDPVELEGSTVSRASLHNVSILKELKLSIGDTIKVYDYPSNCGKSDGNGFHGGNSQALLCLRRGNGNP